LEHGWRHEKIFSWGKRIYHQGKKIFRTLRNNYTLKIVSNSMLLATRRLNIISLLVTLDTDTL
jgi:hypothetical protein